MNTLQVEEIYNLAISEFKTSEELKRTKPHQSLINFGKSMAFGDVLYKLDKNKWQDYMDYVTKKLSFINQ